MDNPFTRLSPAPEWLVERPIAHRALHDKNANRVENSFSAFQAAIDAGYAIECDLQVSKDRSPMVFHDPVLGRLTAVDGNVRDQASDQLEAMKLLDSDDGIYLLRKHLEQVAGRVPLVLELKGVQGHDDGFVEGVADALKSYSGPVAVMSFDHWICEQFQHLLPNVPRGLTAEGSDEVYDTHKAAMLEFDLQFVSYHVDALPNRFVSQVRDAGLPVITWTVRNDQQVAQTFQHADQMTFEGFLPRNTLNRNTYG